MQFLSTAHCKSFAPPLHPTNQPHSIMTKLTGVGLSRLTAGGKTQAAHADKKIVQLSCYVAERMLQEVTMLDYLPSVVACCAIYVARKNMGRTCWSPTLEKYTKYHVEELVPCLTEVRSVRCC